MATKQYCDGCAAELPRARQTATLGKPGDGIARTLTFTIGLGYVQLDLCIACADRAPAVLAEAFPASAGDIREWCEVNAEALGRPVPAVEAPITPVTPEPAPTAK